MLDRQPVQGFLVLETFIEMTSVFETFHGRRFRELSIIYRPNSLFIRSDVYLNLILDTFTTLDIY